jgi:hypothetical protein
MGLEQAVIQLWEVRDRTWEVLVSTGFSVGLGPANPFPLIEVPVEALWIKLETAADATVLKSASERARLTQEEETCIGLG